MFISRPKSCLKLKFLTVKEKKSDAEISVLAKQVASEELSSGHFISLRVNVIAASLTPSSRRKSLHF